MSMERIRMRALAGIRDFSTRARVLASGIHDAERAALFGVVGLEFGLAYPDCEKEQGVLSWVCRVAPIREWYGAVLYLAAYLVFCAVEEGRGKTVLF